MSNINDLDFKPEDVNALDIASLISAPLLALVEANSLMAQAQTKFLLDYCFNKVDDHYEPIMIKMALSQTVISPEISQTIDQSSDGINELPEVSSQIKNVTTYFNIPLLTIMPLNSLAVDKVAIDFYMDITHMVSFPSTEENDSTPKLAEQKAQLKGKISHEVHHENDQTNNIKVSLNAGTLPLPVGILSIIDLYANTIQVNPTKN